MALEAPAGRHLPAPVVSRCWGRARQLTSQPRVHATAAWRRERLTPQAEAGKAGAGQPALAQFLNVEREILQVMISGMSQFSAKSWSRLLNRFKLGQNKPSFFPERSLLGRETPVGAHRWMGAPAEPGMLPWGSRTGPVLFSTF